MSVVLTNLSVQSTGTHRRWIQCIGTIGSHDDFYFTQRIETIHLIEELVRRQRFAVIAGEWMVNPFHQSTLNL